MRILVVVCGLVVAGCHHRVPSETSALSMAEVYRQLDGKCSEDVAELQQVAVRGAEKVEELHAMEMSPDLFAVVLNNHLPPGDLRDCAKEAESLPYQITTHKRGCEPWSAAWLRWAGSHVQYVTR